jgi:hypothetical protein
MRPVGFNAFWLRVTPHALDILQSLGFIYHIDDASRARTHRRTILRRKSSCSSGSVLRPPALWIGQRSSRLKATLFARPFINVTWTLPWRMVGFDQSWNLIPPTQAALHPTM